MSKALSLILSNYTAKMTYIEGWRVINLANDVFGFDGWTSEVKSLEIDFVSYSER